MTRNLTRCICATILVLTGYILGHTAINTLDGLLERRSTTAMQEIGDF